MVCPKVIYIYAVYGISMTIFQKAGRMRGKGEFDYFKFKINIQKTKKKVR